MADWGAFTNLRVTSLVNTARAIVMNIVTNVASAVNYLEISNATTTNPPSLVAKGSDTNIDLSFAPKGTGVIRLGSRTVTNLPAAGVAGRRAFVTDANATTFASVVASGGANGVPVYDDGTNWRIG